MVPLPFSWQRIQRVLDGGQHELVGFDGAAGHERRAALGIAAIGQGLHGQLAYIPARMCERTHQAPERFRRRAAGEPTQCGFDHFGIVMAQAAEKNRVVAGRTQARAAKDFKKSDEIRDQLLKMGISVHDTAEGTIWEVAK